MGLQKQGPRAEGHAAKGEVPSWTVRRAHCEDIASSQKTGVERERWAQSNVKLGRWVHMFTL